MEGNVLNLIVINGVIISILNFYHFKLFIKKNNAAFLKLFLQMPASINVFFFGLANPIFSIEWAACYSEQLSSFND
jgi:hypothetical protein